MLTGQTNRLIEAIKQAGDKGITISELRALGFKRNIDIALPIDAPVYEEDGKCGKGKDKRYFYFDWRNIL